MNFGLEQLKRAQKKARKVLKDPKEIFVGVPEAEWSSLFAEGTKIPPGGVTATVKKGKKKVKIALVRVGSNLPMSSTINVIHEAGHLARIIPDVAD